MHFPSKSSTAIMQNHLSWNPLCFMPLARHDNMNLMIRRWVPVSTHMPLTRHDGPSGFGLPHQCSFYSHASCEAWRKDVREPLTTIVFLLTCLLRGMTLIAVVEQIEDKGFYSHASYEAWQGKWQTAGGSKGFYSHASYEAWPNVHLNGVPYEVSTHMPLTRHDRVLCDNGTFVIVSTHMPLTRHDGWDASPWVWVIVSTHMPLTRHDGGLWNELSGRIEFLLTCLLRGMAWNPGYQYGYCERFYSHASCEAWL